jgi:hypothetical protein
MRLIRGHIFVSIVVLAGAALSALAAVACSEDVGAKSSSGGAGDAGADGGDAFTLGDEVRVVVPGSGRAYVKLASPAGVVTPADPKTDKGWDLAFEGADVFTNGGASGSGAANAFGPLDSVVFLEDVAPPVPFTTTDSTGGAFLRWYFYEGAPNHAIHSRFHVYGIKDGDRTFKVQVVGYYGERDGAPVSGLYQVRWSEVTASGAGPVQEAKNLDGTAGGAQGGADAPGECLDLGTGGRMMLAPSVARTSNTWHLCFHREDVSVNGELGGPRNVGAVDLDADQTASETLTQVVNRDADTERPRFDAIDASKLAGLTYRGDRVVSAFSGLWTERAVSPLAPRRSAWYVLGGDGKSKYLVGFARFEGATATSPGTVVMRVKAAR